MSEQATVTVNGIEIVLTRKIAASRFAPFELGPFVSASTKCACRTELNYGGRMNGTGKQAVKGLLNMIDQHGPTHDRFMAVR